MSGAQPNAEDVRSLALALGFDLVGIADPRPSSETRRFRDWIGAGHAGSMHYLAEGVEKRVDPRLVMEGVRSIVCVGLVYDPGARGPERPGSALIARYAGGEDYHGVVAERLRALALALEALARRPVRSVAHVDTGPVLERALAARAGLGWIGKNACLIHPRLGSFLFLAELFTDLPLDFDTPIGDHCGSCRACLDACPTGAFPEPGVVDSRRCIAYTTIELEGSIAEPLREGHGTRVFGCDICQDVCPWNVRTRREVPADTKGLRSRLAPRRSWRAPDLAWILTLGEQAWRAATRGTALRRAKRRSLLRNALIAAGNSGDAGLLPLVRAHASAGDPCLEEHARWALVRLERTGSDGSPE